MLPKVNIEVLADQYKDEREPPLDTLPEAFQRWVVAFARASGSPQSYCLMAGLSQASMMAASLVLRVQGNYYNEFANDWFCLVGPPGTAKTAAVMAANKPLLDESKSRFNAYMCSVEAAREEGRKGKDAIVPLPSIRVVSGGTTEGLIAALMRLQARSEPPQILGIYDEISAFTGDMNAYRGKGSDEQKALQFWQGGSMPIMLKGEVSMVDNGRLTIIGGIQPAVLREWASNDNGFLDRFLFAVHDGRPAPTTRMRQMDDSISTAFYESMTPYEGLSGTVEILPEADALIESMYKYFHATATRQGRAGTDRKWDRHYHKVMLMYCAMLGRRAVDLDIAQRAGRMMQFLAAEWCRAIDMKDEGIAPEVESLILTKVSRSGRTGITTSQLTHSSGQLLRRNGDLVRDILGRLLGEELIIEEYRKGGKAWKLARPLK